MAGRPNCVMKTANSSCDDCCDSAHCGVETWYFPSNIGRVNMDIPLAHKQPLMSMWSRQHADVIAQTSFFAGFWDSKMAELRAVCCY